MTQEYYAITSLQLDSLALVFMVSGFTTRFAAMWIIDNMGLGIGVRGNPNFIVYFPYSTITQP